MITTRLLGGMGNQMFQYAFALSCARRLGTTVALDGSMLTRPGRAFALGQWSIYLELAKVAPTVVERGMQYNQALVDRVKDGDVLQGYWQSEKYFSYVASELRRDMFVPIKPFEHPLLSKVLTTNSVAIHVRRGDYLKEPHSAFHGNLTYDYYYAAMNLIINRSVQEDPHFFIFSDDPFWCRQVFDLPEVQTVVEPGRESEDIYLMSKCKHVIIANSSFSWWGAWLGDNQPDRMVVAPEKWFADPNTDYSTVVPERWIKI